jgi:hypothetical protein
MSVNDNNSLIERTIQMKLVLVRYICVLINQSHTHFMRILLYTLLVLTFFSCTKDKFSNATIGDHPADYAFPLFSTDLAFKDLIVNVLDDSSTTDELIFNADNTIRLVYSSEVASKKATELFDFIKQVPIPITDTVTCYPLKAPTGVDFKKARIKGGTMTLGFYYGMTTQPIYGTVSMQQMVKNGVPFTYDFILPVNPLASNVLFFPIIPIAGYELSSTNDSICLKYTAHFADGTPTLIPTSASFPSTIGGMLIQNMEISYLEGYWGLQTYPLDLDTIDIDINQSNLRGNIKVKDPKVTITVTNSYGFPTRGKVKYLRFVAPNGDLLELHSPVIDSGGIDWDYPSFAAGEVGQTKYDAFSFDGTNSNIADIFNAQPVRLIYEIEGVANAQNDLNLVGFITDSSTVSFGVQVDLLLEGSVEDFAADQTLDLNFGDYANLDKYSIDSVIFKLVTENKMPVETALQVYFQDANGQNLDSLFQNGIRVISKATGVDANGFPQGTERVESYIPMSYDRFDKIRTAKKAFLKTGFSTTPSSTGGMPPFVKLTSDMSTKVKMGLRIKTKS